MNIEYLSITVLFIALALSIANIYSMFLIQRKINSNVMMDNFNLLKEQISLLEKKQTLHQTQAQYYVGRLETAERLLSALLASHTGLGGSNGNDGTVH